MYDAFLGGSLWSLWVRPKAPPTVAPQPDEGRICLSFSLQCFNAVFRHRADPTLPRPALHYDFRVVREYLTRFPSPTPFGLGLGPD